MGVVVSSSHVVSAAPSSSHSSPAPAWGPSLGRQSSTNFSTVGPSHGLQFCTNCPNVGPFHGVPCFRKRLLQLGSPTGSQVLPGACSSAGSPQGHSLLQAPPAPVWGFSLGCGWGSAPPWASMAAGTACLTMVCSMGCREPLLRRLEHLLPSFCTDLGVCRDVPLT